MRKSILTGLILVLASLVLVSCKKDDTPDNNTSYYVKVKKDGTWLTWTGFAKGEMGPDGFDASLVDLGVTGVSDDGSERLDLTLQKTGTSFDPGTYDSDIDAVVTTSIHYMTGLTTAPESFRIMDDGTNHSRYITNITSITPTAIEGTFTGNFLMAFDGTLLNITEGEFRVERVR
jgi:hypothetical protein